MIDDGRQRTESGARMNDPLAAPVNFSAGCYILAMANKAAAKPKRRRTTMVPVTTMEEIPVLSEEERAALLDSLEQAETRVRSGKAIDYDPKTFKDRLVHIYRGSKR